jgi:hypothetical protein
MELSTSVATADLFYEYCSRQCQLPAVILMYTTFQKLNPPFLKRTIAGWDATRSRT